MVKVAAHYLQSQVDAVGVDRLIQHAVEPHMVFAVQVQGHGQHRLAPRIQQGDLVAIDLIAGRLAAAGETIQGGLVPLEVQGHQAVTAHIDRQLALQSLARGPFLQADAAVDAKAGVGGIGDHCRGVAVDHRAIAVGHLDRQGQVQLVVGAVIQVGVHRHLVIQGRRAMGRYAARHARQGDAQHQGAARSHPLEAVTIAARLLLPG
ncbi:hypothetical protein D3C85_892900 [compost metagenome]